MATSVGRVLELFAWMHMMAYVTSSQCSAKPRGVNFSVISKKNHTGHWNSMVKLKHGNNLVVNENDETGSWEIDVQQSSERCGDWEDVEITVTVSAPPPRAGPGYELVPGLGYYKIHSTPKTWHQARQICYDEGAHLAIVNTDKELKVLQGLISAYPKITEGWQNNHGYVGFHDLYTEGHYLTIYGESLESTGYSKFADGEPNGVGSNCGCVSRTREFLFDVQCDTLMAFFCEQEIL